jgi:hypothetical protein
MENVGAPTLEPTRKLAPGCVVADLSIGQLFENKFREG